MFGWEVCGPLKLEGIGAVEVDCRRSSQFRLGVGLGVGISLAHHSHRAEKSQKLKTLFPSHSAFTATV